MQWIRMWVSLARSHGVRVAWRSMRSMLEERVASHGPKNALRLLRAWYVAGFGAGAALATMAPHPVPFAPGTTFSGEVDPARVISFGVVVAAGVALALRSLAMLLATFSANLLVHRFSVSLRPSAVRGAIAVVIALASSRFAWPGSVWVAVALAVVAWVVWPVLIHALVAARAPRHITHRLMPVDHLVGMAARSLPEESRRQVALHEAGHAVFFGLGDSVPEDLYAWMDEEIEAPEPGSAPMASAGAVGAFTALADKTLFLDLRQGAHFVLLGMVCGGAAAEELVLGSPSAGMIADVAHFETRARQYLALYPDARWPYFVAPAGEAELQTNAQALASFRKHVMTSAIAFLRTNAAVMHRVAEALLAQGELDVQDLRSLLHDVQAAAGFSRFAWPADVPAMPYLTMPPAADSLG